MPIAYRYVSAIVPLASLLLLHSCGPLERYIITTIDHTLTINIVLHLARESKRKNSRAISLDLMFISRLMVQFIILPICSLCNSAAKKDNCLE